MMIGMGHTHWTAKGILQPHWSVMLSKPRMMPLEMNCPMIQHKFT